MGLNIPPLSIAFTGPPISPEGKPSPKILIKHKYTRPTVPLVILSVLTESYILRGRFTLSIIRVPVLA